MTLPYKRNARSERLRWVRWVQRSDLEFQPLALMHSEHQPSGTTLLHKLMPTRIISDEDDLAHTPSGNDSHMERDKESTKKINKRCRMRFFDERIAENWARDRHIDLSMYSSFEINIRLYYPIASTYLLCPKVTPATAYTSTAPFEKIPSQSPFEKDGFSSANQTELRL